MSLALLRAAPVPLIDLASVDPGDESELAQAINLLAAAVLELDALIDDSATGFPIVPASLVLPQWWVDGLKARLAALNVTGPFVLDPTQ